MPYFVSIDSEGVNIGAPEIIDDASWQRHRTFLWVANDGAGKYASLGESQRLPVEGVLGSREILDWLCDLPAVFGQTATYISFSFGYDAAQILADLPYELAWELHNGVSYEWHETPIEDWPDPAPRHAIIWRPDGARGGWQIRYRKGKWFEVRKLKYITPKGVKIFDGPAVRINDVWGYFQASFERALDGMRDHIAISDTERAVIAWGKQARLDFTTIPIHRIATYTFTENKLLCRMMDTIASILDELGYTPNQWHGPGAVIEAVFKKHDVTSHYKLISALHPTSPQIAATHAYYGGRIEMIQHGATDQILYNYDLASAYPAAMVALPSMDVDWCYSKYYNDGPGLDFEQLWEALINNTESRLSIIQMTYDFPPDLAWYPLPYRRPAGTILFPSAGFGWYMADEVCAAIHWCEMYGLDPRACITLTDMYIFQTDPSKPPPFGWIRDMYNRRVTIIAESKASGVPNATEKMLKLIMNSAYGKTAQSIGSAGRAPPTANPYYAAAITAWTRAQLVRAACTNPYAIVLFATDGIVTTEPLTIDIPPQKTLGQWEHDTIVGGVFVQPGIYQLGAVKYKTRGWRPASQHAEFASIISAWERGDNNCLITINHYQTFGQSTITPDRWRRVGWWTHMTRTINVGECGLKRNGIATPAAARELEITLPSINPDPDLLSAPRIPQWLQWDQHSKPDYDDESLMTYISDMTGEGL